MILPDVNLLVFAYNSDAPHHRQARAWWEALLNGSTPVGLPWAVTCGFLRLMTHPAALLTPLATTDASRLVRVWFERPSVEVLEPGPRHLEILTRLLASPG